MQHLARKLLQLTLVSLIKLLSLARADYQLQVGAVSYANPSSRRSNGGCCDLSISCSNNCDTHLEFCFRPPGYSGSVAIGEECPLASRIAGSVGGDSITFGSSIGSLSNPFTIDVGESWLGSFQILVEVFDTDTFNDDFIDVIFGAPYNLSVGNSVTRTYSGRLATITLTFQVSCSGYYYGPKCDVFCEETDSAEKGHYTCDPQTGEKVCRPGYTDPATNCVTAITVTEEPQEPVTTNTTGTAGTTVSTQDGSTDPISSMVSVTTPTTGSPDMSTNTGPGVIGSLSTTVTQGASSASPDVNIAANQETNRRDNIGVIAGPLVAVIVVITTIIVAFVVVLICKKYRNSSKLSSDDLTMRMLSTFNDGIPNATYDPTATGVVYAGTNTERNFDNPLYQSAQFTHMGQSGAADNPTINGGHLNDGDNDSKASSGLYSTIDHRSPNRVWALRPAQNGHYSVITDPN